MHMPNHTHHYVYMNVNPNRPLVLGFKSVINDLIHKGISTTDLMVMDQKKLD